MGQGVTPAPGTKGGFRVRVTGASGNTAAPLATCLVTIPQRPVGETEGRQSRWKPPGPATSRLVTRGQQLPSLSLKIGRSHAARASWKASHSHAGCWAPNWLCASVYPSGLGDG